MVLTNIFLKKIMNWKRTCMSSPSIMYMYIYSYNSVGVYFLSYTTVILFGWLSIFSTVMISEPVQTNTEQDLHVLFFKHIWNTFNLIFFIMFRWCLIFICITGIFKYSHSVVYHFSNKSWKINKGVDKHLVCFVCITLL